jgi:hypothetical protein
MWIGSDDPAEFLVSAGFYNGLAAAVRVGSLDKPSRSIKPRRRSQVPVPATAGAAGSAVDTLQRHKLFVGQ